MKRRHKKKTASRQKRTKKFAIFGNSYFHIHFFQREISVTVHPVEMVVDVQIRKMALSVHVATNSKGGNVNVCF